MKRLFLLVAVLAALPTGAVADIIYDIQLDTSGLVGHPAGDFAVNFQFNDGSGTGNANNTVVLSDFAFGGGGPFGTPTLFGGVSGSLAGTVSILDSSFFNSFTQTFMPGAFLSFRLFLPTAVDPSGTPDQFSFAILDSTGFEIPTEGLPVVGSDVFLLADVDSDNPTLLRFASDLTRAPWGGGDPISIPQPQATIVPEPSTLSLLALAGLLAAALRRRR